MARIGPAALLRRRSIAAIACTTVAAVAVGVAAGQGGGGASVAATPQVPACTHAGKAVGRPSAIPAAVFPPQTILTSVRRRHGLTVVSGVVPLTLHDAVRFFVTGLPAAGYVNGLGDAEMDEAESFFTGAGLHGKWKVNGIPGCPNAVTLSLYVRQ